MRSNCFKFIVVSTVATQFAHQDRAETVVVQCMQSGPEVYVFWIGVVFVALLLYMFARFYRTYLKQNIPEQKKLIPR